MNKLNKFFAAALVALSFNSFAGNCNPLAGEYKIGKSERSDFATISDAVSALQCGGISAPVTFLLENGTYNERVNLTSIAGASFMNTITFESKSTNNTDAVINYVSSEATLVMSGVSYVSFENITISHNVSTYGNCARIEGKTGNIQFKNVVFNGVAEARTGADNATVYFAPNASKTEVSFEDCEINNGSIGIFKSGVSANILDSKTVITGTLFFNQFETGIFMKNENAPVFTNNVITSLSPYKAYIALNYDNVANNLTIVKNIINTPNAPVALALNNCIGQSENNGHISNNSISMGSSSDAFGIYLLGSTDNMVFNFNRIKMADNKAEASNHAYYRNIGSGNNINMLNNICQDLKSNKLTILGNSYKDMFNQLPGQSNSDLVASANGIMVEKVSSAK